MAKTKALINSSSKVNVMTAIFSAKLELRSRLTNVGVQKIDGLLLETYNTTLAMFLIHYSLERIGFFEETFMMADISIELILGMFFLSLSNVNVEFAELRKLT